MPCLPIIGLAGQAPCLRAQHRHHVSSDRTARRVVQTFPIGCSGLSRHLAAASPRRRSLQRESRMSMGAGHQGSRWDYREVDGCGWSVSSLQHRFHAPSTDKTPLRAQSARLLRQGPAAPLGESRVGAPSSTKLDTRRCLNDISPRRRSCSLAHKCWWQGAAVRPNPSFNRSAGGKAPYTRSAMSIMRYVGQAYCRHAPHSSNDMLRDLLTASSTHDRP
jgi:hypothetical protein